MKNPIQYKDTQKLLDTYSTVWCESLFKSILVRTSKINSGGYLKYLASLYGKAKAAEENYYVNVHQPLWKEVRVLAGSRKSVSFLLKEGRQWIEYNFEPYGDSWSFGTKFLDKAPKCKESSFGRKFHNSQERISQLRRRAWIVQDILRQFILTYVSKTAEADGCVLIEVGGLKHLISVKERGAEFLVWNFRPQEMIIG